MRVTLTLRSEDCERDIEVVAEPGATVEQLRPLLTALTPEHGTFPLFAGGKPLAPGDLLGDAGLRSGCVIDTGASGMRPVTAGSALQLRVVGGPDSGQVMPLPRGRHLIGRGHRADLRLEDPDVSRRHAELRVDLRGVSVRDLHSTNGTWLNAEPVTSEPTPLALGEVLTLGGSRLCVQIASEPPAAITPEREGTILVHRPPRIRESISPGPVEFPAEPASGNRPRLQWFTALPAAAFGVGCALIMHNSQFLAFALLSPFTVLAGAAVDRRQWRRGTVSAQALHAQAEGVARAELDDRLAAEALRRHHDCPDAAAVLQAAVIPDCRLWERRPGETAFLTVRLGTADQSADTRASRSGRLLPSEVIVAAPATVSLVDGSLGLAGPLPLVRGTARWVIGQLLALHSPRDLSVVALFDGEIAEWRWLRWACATLRAVATRPEEHRLLLSDLMGIIADRQDQRSGDSWLGPRIVLLLDRASGLAGLDVLRSVLEQGPAVGVTAICVDENSRLLPPSCRSTAVLVSEIGSLLELRQPGRAALRAVTDRVSPRWADQLARSLAPLRDAESTGGTDLPEEVWLTELLGEAGISARSLLRGWAASTSPATPIGIAATGPVELDLLRDGPHLLIAGSTGSGKSELLRSLVTGLAARHAPDDVAFVLIDYKGGAAFAECAEFPHTVGLVTDLDGHLTSRALSSLNAEIRRRESALAAAGVADLEGYRRSPLSQLQRLPRLVLVVDEFAYLAEELPTFLSGLIGIAQRGRSLGLHLVLATQRPAGVVSPQIRANIALRIALRVTEAAESHDVIGSDVAHRIPKNQPGRGFARLADGLVEFQAARTGQQAVAQEPIAIAALDAWNRKSAPAAAVPEFAEDLQLLREAMLGAVAQLRRPLPQRPWLPPLPSRLTAAELGPEPSAPFDIRYGLVDDPGRQRQFAACHDLTAGGSIGFIGSPRSGRTTALQSFLAAACAQLGPQQLHLYVVDCAGQGFHHLSEVSHCGAVVGRDDPSAVARLITRLVEEVEARQRVLAGLGVSTLAEAHLAGTPLPVIVVALDGWEGFIALSDDYDAGRSVEALLRLLRDGVAVGITLLIAGDRALLGMRIAPALSRKLLLALIDRGDYAGAGLSLANLPVQFGPGRAVSADDGLEIQLALFTRDADPRAEQATACRRSPTDSPPPIGGPTIRIRSLPLAVRQADLASFRDRHRGEGSTGHKPTDRSGDCLLGVGGDDAHPVWTQLFHDHARFLICGPPLSGRSTTAVVIARQALEAGFDILIAAPPRSPLAAWAVGHGLNALGPATPVGHGDECYGVSGQVILIDDAEQFNDTASGTWLTELAASSAAAVITTARSDDLAVTYRGPAAAVRRGRTGLLLQPGPTDGDLLGIRVGARRMPLPTGRGLLITDALRTIAPDGLALQVAT